MEVVQYDKPVDRVRAFIRDYARQLYGIENASAFMPLIEIAFDRNSTAAERTAAARELLKYSEVPTRSIEYDSGKNGPDVEVEILGVCEIVEPDKNPEPVEPASASAAPLELSYEGREEGG